MIREHFICWPDSPSLKVRRVAFKAARKAGLLPAGGGFLTHETAEAAKAALPALQEATGVVWEVSPCRCL